MSAETIEWLNSNTLVGNTDKRGKAWWYRGTEDNHFPGPIPTERVLQLLDVPLVRAELTATYVTEDGVTTVPIEDRMAVVRADTGDAFGIFKQGYQIHGYVEWCNEHLEQITGASLDVGTAMLLRKGAVAALQCELEETRTAAEGVKHRPFATAATSSDGSMSTTYLLGTQLWWCDNTLSLALKEVDALRYKIKHTRHSTDKIAEARTNLGLVIEQVGDIYDEAIRKLTSEYVSDATWNEFVKAYTHVETAKPGRSKTMAETKVTKLNKLWLFDERVAPWKNSAYGVVAAVNTAVHHEFSVKGMERAERNMLRTIEGDWAAVDGGALRLLASVK